jgi:hypothetical protein
MKYLFLDSNQLLNVSSFLFFDLVNLERLDLWGNSMSSLEFLTFQRLSKLNDLYLNQNEITCLNSTMLIGL